MPVYKPWVNWILKHSVELGLDRFPLRERERILNEAVIAVREQDPEFRCRERRLELRQAAGTMVYVLLLVGLGYSERYGFLPVAGYLITAVAATVGLVFWCRATGRKRVDLLVDRITPALGRHFSS